jgi:hypothetical protein
MANKEQLFNQLIAPMVSFDIVEFDYLHSATYVDQNAGIFTVKSAKRKRGKNEVKYDFQLTQQSLNLAEFLLLILFASCNLLCRVPN